MLWWTFHPDFFAPQAKLEFAATLVAHARAKPEAVQAAAALAGVGAFIRRADSLLHCDINR